MKTIFTKRALAILLCLSMVVTMFAGMSFSASATVSSVVKGFNAEEWTIVDSENISIVDGHVLAKDKGNVQNDKTAKITYASSVETEGVTFEYDYFTPNCVREGFAPVNQRGVEMRFGIIRLTVTEGDNFINDGVMNYTFNAPDWGESYASGTVTATPLSNEELKKAGADATSSKFANGGFKLHVKVSIANSVFTIHLGDSETPVINHTRSDGGRGYSNCQPVIFVGNSQNWKLEETWCELGNFYMYNTADGKPFEGDDPAYVEELRAEMDKFANYTFARNKDQEAKANELVTAYGELTAESQETLASSYAYVTAFLAGKPTAPEVVDVADLVQGDLTISANLAYVEVADGKHAITTTDKSELAGTDGSPSNDGKVDFNNKVNLIGKELTFNYVRMGREHGATRNPDAHGLNFYLGSTEIHVREASTVATDGAMEVAVYNNGYLGGQSGRVSVNAKKLTQAEAQAAPYYAAANSEYYAGSYGAWVMPVKVKINENDATVDFNGTTISFNLTDAQKSELADCSMFFRLGNSWWDGGINTCEISGVSVKKVGDLQAIYDLEERMYAFKDYDPKVNYDKETEALELQIAYNALNENNRTFCTPSYQYVKSFLDAPKPESVYETFVNDYVKADWTTTENLTYTAGSADNGKNSILLTDVALMDNHTITYNKTLDLSSANFKADLVVPKAYKASGNKTQRGMRVTFGDLNVSFVETIEKEYDATTDTNLSKNQGKYQVLINGVDTGIVAQATGYDTVAELKAPPVNAVATGPYFSHATYGTGAWVLPVEIRFNGTSVVVVANGEVVGSTTLTSVLTACSPVISAGFGDNWAQDAPGAYITKAEITNLSVENCTISVDQVRELEREMAAFKDYDPKADFDKEAEAFEMQAIYNTMSENNKLYCKESYAYVESFLNAPKPEDVTENLVDDVVASDWNLATNNLEITTAADGKHSLVVNDIVRKNEDGGEATYNKTLNLIDSTLEMYYTRPVGGTGFDAGYTYGADIILGDLNLTIDETESGLASGRTDVGVKSVSSDTYYGDGAKTIQSLSYSTADIVNAPIYAVTAGTTFKSDYYGGGSAYVIPIKIKISKTQAQFFFNNSAVADVTVTLTEEQKTALENCAPKFDLGYSVWWGNKASVQISGLKIERSVMSINDVRSIERRMFAFKDATPINAPEKATEAEELKALYESMTQTNKTYCEDSYAYVTKYLSHPKPEVVLTTIVGDLTSDLWTIGKDGDGNVYKIAQAGDGKHVAQVTDKGKANERTVATLTNPIDMSEGTLKATLFVAAGTNITGDNTENGLWITIGDYIVKLMPTPGEIPSANVILDANGTEVAGITGTTYTSVAAIQAAGAVADHATFTNGGWSFDVAVAIANNKATVSVNGAEKATFDVDSSTLTSVKPIITAGFSASWGGNISCEIGHVSIDAAHMGAAQINAYAREMYEYKNYNFFDNPDKEARAKELVEIYNSMSDANKAYCEEVIGYVNTYLDHPVPEEISNLQATDLPDMTNWTLSNAQSPKYTAVADGKHVFELQDHNVIGEWGSTVTYIGTPFDLSDANVGLNFVTPKSYPATGSAANRGMELTFGDFSFKVTEVLEKNASNMSENQGRFNVSVNGGAATEVQAVGYNSATELQAAPVYAAATSTYFANGGWVLPIKVSFSGTNVSLYVVDMENPVHTATVAAPLTSCSPVFNMGLANKWSYIVNAEVTNFSVGKVTVSAADIMALERRMNAFKDYTKAENYNMLGEAEELEAAYNAMTAKNQEYCATSYAHVRAFLDSTDVPMNMYVNFKAKDGTVESIGTPDVSASVSSLYDKTTANFKTALVLPNYTLVGWQDETADSYYALDGGIIAGEGTHTLIPVYVVNSDKFTLVVNNVEQGKYAYNTKATVKSTAADFTEWKDVDNNTAVSFAKNYSFWMVANRSLTEVTGSTPSFTTPHVAFTGRTVTDGVAEIITERYIPEGYKLKDAGIIFSTKDVAISELTLANVDSVTMFAGHADLVSYEANAQYAVKTRKNVAVVRAFLTYKDLEGNEVTAYFPE